MTIGTYEDGTLRIELSPDEKKRFLAGKPVTKCSGDRRGVFTVAVKITRPRSREKRFPAALGYAQPQRRSRRK